LKTEDLYIALNAITLALRLAASAAKPFTADIDELETGSKRAASVAYIKNHLSDAQKSLADAEGEIGRLIQQVRLD
jgi:Flp pilus assembly protein CpaB